MAAPIVLRRATAGQSVLLGTFLDTAGAAVTGLTIANTDIRVLKHGSGVEAAKNSGGATHVAAGRYLATFDATDSNTVGPNGEVNVAVSGALPVRRPLVVLHEAVYDVLYGSVAPSTHTAAAVQTLVAAGTVAGVAGNVTGSVGSVTGNVGGSVASVVGNVGGSVGSVANPSGIADAVWDEPRTGHTTAGTFGLYLDAQVSTITGGGGGTADWTADERTALRTILGIPATGTTPTTGLYATAAALAANPAVNVTQIAGAAVNTGSAQLGVNVVNWGGTATGTANVRANVVQYNGVAGTFSAGRPEVNATHWGGTAVASANVRANVVQVAGQAASAAAAVTFPAAIGTSTLDAAGVWAHATRTLTAASGGATDWTADERAALRTILGIPATGTVPGIGLYATASGLTAAVTPLATTADVTDAAGDLSAQIAALPLFNPATTTVRLDLAQPMAFRDVSLVVAPNLGDCLAASFVVAAGTEQVAGTTYVKRQPSGQPFRTFTLDDPTNPNQRS